MLEESPKRGFTLRVWLIGFFVSVLVPSLWACESSAEPPGNGGVRTVESAVQTDRYPWLSELDEAPELAPLASVFSPPKGYARVEVEPESFSDWVRGLPLRLDRHHVLSHRGARLSSPSAAVVFMDVGRANLQQCADSAIRLHAEYLWHKGRAKEVSYHFTSGDKSTWKAWQRGERFKIAGSRVKRVQGKARRNNHLAFRGYLDNIFRYAGTRSLARDSRAVKTPGDLRPGDFFVQPGGPGHAVVILDIAESASGERVALVGQGFMPAQEFHVVQDASVALDKVWFPLPSSKNPQLQTPSWTPFEMSMARRFKPE